GCNGAAEIFGGGYSETVASRSGNRDECDIRNWDATARLASTQRADACARERCAGIQAIRCADLLMDRARSEHWAGGTDGIQLNHEKLRRRNGINAEVHRSLNCGRKRH